MSRQTRLAGVPAKFSRTWLRDGKTIPGATASSYVLTAADANKQISVRTSFKPFRPRRSGLNIQGFWPSAAVAHEDPLFLHVTDTARPCYTLSVKAMSGRSGASVSYRWLRNGGAIKGATKAKHRLSVSEAGK